MNIVTPIVVPMGGGIRGGGGGSCSEVVDQLMESMPLFLGVPWGVFVLLIMIGLGISAVKDDLKTLNRLEKCGGWMLIVSGTYTLIYVLYWLVRYLIER